ISLLNEGYKLLNSIAPISADARAQAVDRLVAAVGVAGLTSGQWNDLYPASDGGLDAITRTHAGKTGALFAASLAIAGCLADRPPEMIAALDKAGRAIGVAFQGYDDLLDRYAARAVIGKDTGLDEQRKTIADQMDRATAIAWCEAQLDDGLRHLAAAGLAETDLTVYIRSLAVRLAAPLCKTELAAASQP
ncbi:MAG: polyprenyl synthetase family protein, partial [Pseudomonadota bacterium]